MLRRLGARIGALGLLVTGSAVLLTAVRPAPSAPGPAEPLVVPSPAGEGPDLLVLDTVLPVEPVALLWLEGRTTQPADGDARLARDGAGGVLSVDQRLRVQQLPLGLEGREVASIAAAADGFWLTDASGEVIRVDRSGEVVSTGAGPFAYPSVAGDPRSGEVWLVRSAERFAYRAEGFASPLLVRLRDGSDDTVRIGRAIRPAHFLLADLANAGHVAAGDRAVYYAPFIRDEVAAFTPAGDTLWLTHRHLPQTTGEPRFEVQDRRVVIDYHPVNLGLTLGPDGLLYVLSTPGFTTTEGRLDVLDPGTGRVRRTARLSTARPTIAVGHAGRAYLLDPSRLLTGVAEREREAAPEFDLPAMTGGRLSSAELRGRLVLLNFWASWCAPCRTEMPALDSLWREIADPGFAFVGVNEDHDVGAARAFMREFGFQFPVVLGRGDMRRRFHYPGLPYTLLLDPDGRIAGRWIGFAGPEQLQAMRALIRSELERAGPKHGGHRHGP